MKHRKKGWYQACRICDGLTFFWIETACNNSAEVMLLRCCYMQSQIHLFSVYKLGKHTSAMVAYFKRCPWFILVSQHKIDVWTVDHFSQCLLHFIHFSSKEIFHRYSKNCANFLCILKFFLTWLISDETTEDSLKTQTHYLMKQLRIHSKYYQLVWWNNLGCTNNTNNLCDETTEDALTI